MNVVYCLIGSYSSSGSASCTLCPEGNNCNDPSQSPMACTAGTYSEAGAAGCKACPSGTYLHLYQAL